MKTSEILQKALTACGRNGEHWTGSGHFTERTDKKGCMWTYIRLAVLEYDAGAQGNIAKLAARFSNALGFPDYVELFNWNDVPERVFAEVRDRFTTAIAAFASQGD